jgi:hypothetical protein
MRTTWTTKDGVVIPIVKLTDPHLLNIINMLLRHAEAIRWRRLREVGAYLANDPPDGAWDAASKWEDTLLEMDQYEVIETVERWAPLIREAKRRLLI